MEVNRYFSSSTLMGKQENKKMSQLLQTLFDSAQSFQFRTPVDYIAYGLLDYPMIIKKPMDLGTVKRNLNNNNYQTVQSCLVDIQLIWDNCKTYNTPQNVSLNDIKWIYKQADKLDKMTKKMIRNYVPFVKMQNPTDKRRGPKKQAPIIPSKKPALKIPQPQPKDYLQKKQQLIEKPQQIIIQCQFSRLRKQFLLFVPLCTPEQVGVIFMLIRKHSNQALQFIGQGNVNINMQFITDNLLKRLMQQLQMWGIGYAPTKKR